MSVEGRELGWEEEIQEDGKEFILLPEGDYDFTISKFDRDRTRGEGKLPPCNMAVVYFLIKNPHGEDVEVRENFILHTSLEWKISELFCGVGLKQKGEKVPMRWTSLPGLSGRCSIGQREYTTKDGEKRKSNHIKKIYPKEKKFEAGKF